jgi:sn-glycerol 3-phosphate transport system substrate-binding protein
VKQKWEKYPELKVTVDQLHDTVFCSAHRGTFISIFPEARPQNNWYGKPLPSIDPKEALDKAAADVDTVLEKSSLSR